MSYRGKSVFVCLMLVAVCVWFQARRGESAQRPPALAADKATALQGEAAVRQLKSDGGYASLAAAMAAARYQINAAPAKSAAPFYANNPGQQLRASFASDEVRVSAASNQTSGKTDRKTSGKTDGAELRLQLAGYGYGDQLEPLTKGELTAHGDRIEIKKSALRTPQSAITEWYVNKPEGLEQGFTLAAPPAPRKAGEWLRVVLAVGAPGSGWRASLRGDQQGAFFERQADGCDRPRLPGAVCDGRAPSGFARRGQREDRRRERGRALRRAAGILCRTGSAQCAAAAQSGRARRNGRECAG